MGQNDPFDLERFNSLFLNRNFVFNIFGVDSNLLRSMFFNVNFCVFDWGDYFSMYTTMIFKYKINF